MCVVSMIGDHFNDKFKQPYYQQIWTTSGHPTQEEFDELKNQVEEMKALLKKAKIYDEENNEPNCEMEDKMALLRKVAEAVGVDLDDVLNNK